MITIHCTALEKKRLMKAIDAGQSSIPDATCLFPRKANFCVLDRDASCEKCLETKIKWVITGTGG